MNMVENNDDRERLEQARLRIIDWIFLPLPLAFTALGIGILTGLVFQDNLLLQGAMRMIIGIGMTIYGAARSTMIIMKLRGKKKGKLWIKKS